MRFDIGLFGAHKDNLIRTTRLAKDVTVFKNNWKFVVRFRHKTVDQLVPEAQLPPNTCL